MIFKKPSGRKTKTDYNEKLLQGDWILIVKKVINPEVDVLHTKEKCIKRYLLWVLIFKLKNLLQNNSATLTNSSALNKLSSSFGLLWLPRSAELPGAGSSKQGKK